MPRTSPQQLARHAWRGALACFVLAGATGAWLRFGTIYGLPPFLRFDDVRHAHSHLMFFGWVTPALVAFGGARLARSGARMRGMGWLIAALLASAVASYPAFLSSGYRLTSVLGREVPLSMMAAGASGLGWLAFLGMYAAATWRVRAAKRADPAIRASLPWLDAAALLLLASTLAIGGLAAAGMSGALGIRLAPALVDAFLTLFGEGWFVAGVLGLAYAAWSDVVAWPGETSAADASPGPRPVPGRPRPTATWPAWMFAAGSILRAAADLALAVQGQEAIAGGASVTAAAAVAGRVAVGAAVIWACARLLARGARRGLPPLWTTAIVFILGKGVVELGLAVPSLDAATSAGPLRVMLLHALLLGGVSISLVAASGGLAGSVGSRLLPWAFVAAVVVHLAALAPLTPLWPSGATGAWALHAAAVTSLGPPLAALGLLVGTFSSRSPSRARSRGAHRTRA